MNKKLKIFPFTQPKNSILKTFIILIFRNFPTEKVIQISALASFLLSVS